MAQLAQRTRLELANSLPRDAELDADLLERPAARSIEPEPEHEDSLEPGLELRQGAREFRRAEPKRRLRLGPDRVRILDQVAHHALAVPDRRLETDVVLDEVEELGDAERRELCLRRDLVERRVAASCWPSALLARWTRRTWSAMWTGSRIVRLCSASAR